jgi:hypothetical protein
MAQIPLRAVLLVAAVALASAFPGAAIARKALPSCSASVTNHCVDRSPSHKARSHRMHQAAKVRELDVPGRHHQASAMKHVKMMSPDKGQ